MIRISLRNRFSAAFNLLVIVVSWPTALTVECRSLRSGQEENGRIYWSEARTGPSVRQFLRSNFDV